MNRETHFRGLGQFGCDGASMRVAAAMAERRSTGPGRSPFDGPEAAARPSAFVREAAESDAQYFGRRSREEQRAAGEAAGPEAREAHSALGARYALLSRLQPRIPAPRHDASGERARLAELLGRRFGVTASGIARDEVRLDAAPQLWGKVDPGRYENVAARPSW